jgi:type I restriction enzyme S subunit
MSDANEIPKGWFTTALGTVVEILSSKRIFAADYVDNGIPFYRSKEIIEKAKGQTISTSLFITRKRFENIKNNYGAPVSGDMLISAVGARAGIPYLVANDGDFYFKDGNLIWFRNFSEQLNSHFLSYFFNTRYGQLKLESIMIGSAQKALTIVGLKGLTINLPNPQEQKAIANILLAFDNKIRNLQAQNKTLEQTAQTIFKEWFGKYQLGDDLPNDWRVFRMNELVETVNGYSYKGKELVEESDEALVTLKNFDRNGGFQTRGYKPFKGIPKETQEVIIGDLIVAHTDLTQDAEVLGNPAFIFDNGGFNKMFITMDLVKVNPIHKDISSSFLYYLMKDRRFKGHCVGYSNGTTVLHLSKKAIPEYQLPLPKDFTKVIQFSDIANSTTTKISLNKEAINNLEETRDTLLPRLMSGQVRINEFKD